MLETTPPASTVSLVPKATHSHDSAEQEHQAWFGLSGGLLLASIASLAKEETVSKGFYDALAKHNPQLHWQDTFGSQRPEVTEAAQKAKSVLPAAWQRPAESSALFSKNPKTWLKALGVLASVQMLNVGLGISPPPWLAALETGAAAHVLIPGTLGYRVGHWATMAPLLVAMASAGQWLHGKTTALLEQQTELSPTQQSLASSGVGLVMAAGMGIGAMLAFPRLHLLLANLKLSKESKGWYLHTIHGVDGLAHAASQSWKAWRDKESPAAHRVAQDGWAAMLKAAQQAPQRPFRSGEGHFYTDASNPAYKRAALQHDWNVNGWRGSWKLTGSEAGAVSCANGCCTGSVLCLNEAMALGGSLLAASGNLLHPHSHEGSPNNEKG